MRRWWGERRPRKSRVPREGAGCLLGAVQSPHCIGGGGVTHEETGVRRQFPLLVERGRGPATIRRVLIGGKPGEGTLPRGFSVGHGELFQSVGNQAGGVAVAAGIERRVVAALPRTYQ